MNLNYNDAGFLPSEVTVENIKELAEKQSVLEERRILELSEMADEALRGFYASYGEDFGVYEILSYISIGAPSFVFEGTDGALQENRKALLAFAERLSVADKAAFAAMVYERMPAYGRKIAESDFFEKRECGSYVAFVKNALASEAYDVFAEELKEPRLRYAKDMKEAVSLLLSGDAGYAILPLEEGSGQRLTAVSELIFKEDLKINSVTPVFGPLGGADMKYALVSRSISIPDIAAGDDRYLEIRVAADGACILNEILSVAHEYEISPYRINTISFASDAESLQYYSLVLKLEVGDFSKFLTYLTLFGIDYTALGIYKNLE